MLKQKTFVNFLFLLLIIVEHQIYNTTQQANAVLSSLNLNQKEVVGIQVNNTSSSPPIFKTVQESALTNRAASTPVVGGEQQVEASVTLQISY